MDVGTPPAQYCSECGRPHPADDLARFGNRLICAECKNGYLQRLREGAAGAPVGYAGFWVRFVAAILDALILSVPSTMVQLALLRLLPVQEIERMMAAWALMYLLELAIAATYEGVFVGRFAATPGKMALNLKVVRADGTPVSMGRSFARHFAKMLSGIILGIGFIMAGFDSQKRALHDMLCDTRVIKAGS